MITSEMTVTHEHGESGVDSLHAIRTGFVECHDGTRQPIVEVYERHGDVERTRRVAISTFVHTLINISEADLWRIEGAGHPTKNKK